MNETMKKNYELHECNESFQEFGCQGSEFLRMGHPKGNSYPFATKLQNSICTKFALFVSFVVKEIEN